MLTSLAIWSAITARMRPKRRTTSRTWSRQAAQVALLARARVVAHLQLDQVAAPGEAASQPEVAPEAGLAVGPEEAVEPQHEGPAGRAQARERRVGARRPLGHGHGGRAADLARPGRAARCRSAAPGRAWPRPGAPSRRPCTAARSRPPEARAGTPATRSKGQRGDDRDDSGNSQSGFSPAYRRHPRGRDDTSVPLGPAPGATAPARLARTRQAAAGPPLASAAWPTSPRSCRRDRSPTLVREDGAQLVDVREPYEHEAGRIAGDVHIELERLTAEADSIDRDRPVVFYCRSGSRSALAAQAFGGIGLQRPQPHRRPQGVGRRTGSRSSPPTATWPSAQTVAQLTGVGAASGGAGGAAAGAQLERLRRSPGRRRARRSGRRRSCRRSRRGR